ncbi:hypothetical protein ACFYMW_16410 [Streptomyces sp. NPDC006692]|uniref:hypothetical protein n=1 Tax=unclassified Streptomyces TaxID=2593676 RepID=UPI003674AFD9
MTEQLTRYDRRMYAIMNRREAAPLYATAGRRRLVVAVHIALTAAFVAAWLGALVGGSLVAAWLLLGLLLPWCVATGAINAATRGLLELRRRALDERQRAERDAVIARAHRLTTGLLLVAAAAVGAYTLAGGSAASLAFPVLLAVFVAHWLTPHWVAGLRVQDEQDDQDDA